MSIDTERGPVPRHRAAMANTPSWLYLVPGSLPESRMFIQADGVDLRELVDAEDLLPLLEVTAQDAERRDLRFDVERYFIDPSHHERFRIGQNCYTYSTIRIERACIELVDCACGDAGPAGDRLIARLVERGIPFQWSAFSFYTDGCEASEIRHGAADTFRAT